MELPLPSLQAYNRPMKSSYELAMERYAAKEGAETPLTEEQKKRLAAIDEKYRAKIAEREIFLNPKIAQAQAAGQRRDADDIRRQLGSEKARLEEERDAEKEAIRKG